MFFIFPKSVLCGDTFCIAALTIWLRVAPESALTHDVYLSIIVLHVTLQIEMWNTFLVRIKLISLGSN